MNEDDQIKRRLCTRSSEIITVYLREHRTLYLRLNLIYRMLSMTSIFRDGGANPQGNYLQLRSSICLNFIL